MSNSTLYVEPKLFNDYPSLTGYTKKVLYDETITPTYAVQIIGDNSNSCGAKIYKVPLTKGVIYVFNPYLNISMGLYDDYGVLKTSGSYISYQSNFTGDAYYAGSPVYTTGFRYSCSLSIPQNVKVALNGSSVSVSWDSVPAATSYKVYRSSSGSGTYAFLANSTTANYTDNSPLSGYNCYKVEAHRSSNPTTQSDLSSYDCVNYTGSSSAPSCATLNSPADNKTDVATNATLTWDAVSNATSYDVCFGTSSNPSYVTNVTATSYTPSLACGNTYYWKIVPKNSNGSASGCTTWKFTTVSCGGQVPSCATPISPTNNATNVATNATLTWNAVSNATSYDVYFGTSSSPSRVERDYTATSYTPTLTTNETYYWKIAPKNSNGSASGCQIWKFTTGSGGQSGNPVAKLNPTSWNAGSVNVGNSVFQSFILKNEGTGTLTVSGISPLSGTSWGINPDPTSMNIYAGQSKTFIIEFNPNAIGTKNNSLSIYTNGGTVSIQLSGEGVSTSNSLPIAIVTPTFWDVSSNATQNFTLRNAASQGDPLRITNDPKTNLSSSWSTNFNANSVLNAQQEYYFSITFSPTSGGSFPSSFVIMTNGNNLIIPLNGTSNLGITEYSEGQIKIHPNPTTGQLTIACRDAACHVPTVEIYSVVGQMVYTSPNPSKGGELAPSPLERAGGEVVIDISHLASGMYYLKVGNNTVRFVKE